MEFQSVKLEAEMLHSTVSELIQSFNIIDRFTSLSPLELPLFIYNFFLNKSLSSFSLCIKYWLHVLNSSLF